MLRLAGHVRAGQTGLDAFFKSPQNSQTLGRVFNLTIQLPAQSSLIAVPVQSIYANNRVYTVRDSRLVSYQIQRVGERETAESGYQILIRSDDIIDGEKIITTQLPRAITGLLVEVVNQGS
ncbi:MAG: hypothetical protein GXP16_08565 [Gammaproteobacteria bacterium]|nr:hypothetical protein [Gammaproteobacteria bacterium]